MQTCGAPLTLRLPFGMADRHLRLEQVLAADRSRSWAQCQPLLACFALTRQEKRFAKRLMKRKRNLWLFRCNQRAFCGDFIVVDMSVAHPRLRPAFVIELKSRASLVVGGGGAGNQLQNAAVAVDELAEQTGIVASDAPVTLVCGDPEGVLRWIEMSHVNQ